MKATITFYPNQGKANKKSGSIPIYMRLVLKRQKTESRLMVEIPPNKLPIWDPITMRLVEKNSAINHYLSRIEQKYHEFIIFYSGGLTGFTVHHLRNHILGEGGSTNPTVLKYVDDFFNGSVLNNINKRPGTIKNYRRAINHMISFIKTSNYEKMQMQDFKIETAIGFKNFLVNANPTLDRAGMAKVSAATVICMSSKQFELLVRDSFLITS